MFSKLTKQQLNNIYLDFILSKNEGKRCESLVPYAYQYKEPFKDLMTVSTAIDIVTKIFFEEVASRYFN